MNARPTSRDPADELRVLSVVASRRRRGAEVFASDLARALADHHVRAEVVAVAAGSPTDGDLPMDALGRRRLEPRAVYRLARLSRHHDVLVANGSSSLPATAFVRATGGPPVVARSIGDPDAWVGDAARRARVAWALRRAEQVVALWPAAADRLVELHGLDDRRVTVIPNAADATAFRPVGPQDRDRLRSELGLPVDGPVILAVGALSPEKRLDAAIDAVAPIDGATLTIVGDGPEHARLAERARDAGNRVRVTGAVADPRPWYGAADVLVLPSRTEGMPAVLIEAGLSGLPVVATDVGAVGEVVADGATGRLVGATALGDLTEAISEALTRQHEWGAAAVTRCRERFSLSTVAAAWATTLRSAC